MTIKELFKMVESVNTFNEIVGERKRNYISLVEDRIFNLKDENGNSKFYTLKEFKKALRYTYIKEEENKIITANYIQENQYKNYFNFELFEISICEL